MKAHVVYKTKAIKLKVDYKWIQVYVFPSGWQDRYHVVVEYLESPSKRTAHKIMTKLQLLKYFEYDFQLIEQIAK